MIKNIIRSFIMGFDFQLKSIDEYQVQMKQYEDHVRCSIGSSIPKDPNSLTIRECQSIGRVVGSVAAFTAAFVFAVVATTSASLFVPFSFAVCLIVGTCLLLWEIIESKHPDLELDAERIAMTNMLAHTYLKNIMQTCQNRGIDPADVIRFKLLGNASLRTYTVFNLIGGVYINKAQRAYDRASAEDRLANKGVFQEVENMYNALCREVVSDSPVHPVTEEVKGESKAAPRSRTAQSPLISFSPTINVEQDHVLHDPTNLLLFDDIATPLQTPVELHPLASPVVAAPVRATREETQPVADPFADLTIGLANSMISSRQQPADLLGGERYVEVEKPTAVDDFVHVDLNAFDPLAQ